MDGNSELLDPPKEKRPLHESGNVLFTGILSVIFITIIGVLLAVATILKANPKIREFETYPNLYNEKHYKRIKLGKNIAFAGLLLKGLAVAITLIFLN